MCLLCLQYRSLHPHQCVGLSVCACRSLSLSLSLPNPPPTVVDGDHGGEVDAGGGGEEAGLDGKGEVDAEVLLPGDVLPLVDAEPVCVVGDGGERACEGAGKGGSNHEHARRSSSVGRVCRGGGWLGLGMERTRVVVVSWWDSARARMPFILYVASYLYLFGGIGQCAGGVHHV